MYSRARAGRTIAVDRSLCRFVDRADSHDQTPRAFVQIVQSLQAGNVAGGGVFCIAFEIRFDVLFLLRSIQRGFLFFTTYHFYSSGGRALARRPDDDLPKTGLSSWAHLGPPRIRFHRNRYRPPFSLHSSRVSAIFLYKAELMIATRAVASDFFYGFHTVDKLFIRIISKKSEMKKIYEKNHTRIIS